MTFLDTVNILKTILLFNFIVTLVFWLKYLKAKISYFESIRRALYSILIYEFLEEKSKVENKINRQLKTFLVLIFISIILALFIENRYKTSFSFF